MQTFRYSKKEAAVTAKWQTGHKNSLVWLWSAAAVAMGVLAGQLLFVRGMGVFPWTTNIAAVVGAVVLCTMLQRRENRTARILMKGCFSLRIADRQVLVTDPVTKDILFRCAFGDILRVDEGKEIVRLQTVHDGVCLPTKAIPRELTDFMQENDDCAVYTRSWM